MAIAFVGTPTTYQGSAAQTSITVDVPAGVVEGDLICLVMFGSTVSTLTSPSGWTVLTANTNTSIRLNTYSRVATSTTPASYTITVPSAVWTAAIFVVTGYTGTLTSTAAPTIGSGTTLRQPPAITTPQYNSWVINIDAGLAAAGVTNTVWSSSNTTLDLSVSGQSGTLTNPTFGLGHVELPLDGTFTGAFSVSPANVFSRSLAVSFVLAADDTGNPTTPRINASQLEVLTMNGFPEVRTAAVQLEAIVQNPAERRVHAVQMEAVLITTNQEEYWGLPL